MQVAGITPGKHQIYREPWGGGEARALPQTRVVRRVKAGEI